MSKAFYVALKSNPDQTGVAIHTETQPIPSRDVNGKPDGGIQYQGIVHVLWDDPEFSSPAPSFHTPEDLTHMGIFVDSDIDNDAEDEEEEEEATQEAPAHDTDSNPV
jgi:hypothetical protein